MKKELDARNVQEMTETCGGNNSDESGGKTVNKWIGIVFNE